MTLLRRLVPAVVVIVGLLAVPAVQAAGDNPFIDVPNGLDDAVDWADANDYIDGFGNRYRPNDPMTRGVFVGALHRIAGSPAGHPPHGLTDVPPSLDDAVNWAVDEGLIVGYADLTFRPNTATTRGAVTRILFNAAGQPGGFGPNGFSDVPAKLDGAVDWIVDDPDDGGPLLPIAAGFSNNTYRHRLVATRGQVTRMLNRRYLITSPPPAITVTEVQDGLTIPWGLDFTPDGTMLFTERPGFMSALAPPYTGTPTELISESEFLAAGGYVNGETGFLDLQVSPDFATDRKVFTCQGHDPASGPPRIALFTWTIDESFTTATRSTPPLINNLTTWGQQGRHGGCRLEFGPDGKLWIGTGDGALTTNSQDLQTLGGKVLRVDPDTGAGVADNPFFQPASPSSNRSRIHNYGHRNVQGMVRRPGTDQMWSVEHGTFRDDEINLMVEGGNYGWRPGNGYDESPPMTNLSRFPNAIMAKWSSGNPTIAPSGADFIEGSEWGSWEGAMAVGILADQHLRVMFFSSSGALVRQDRPEELDGDFGRIRTVTMGPGGALYVTTANGGGNDQILRITPDP